MAIRNQKEYDLKRDEIIRVAEELFLKNGFNNTTFNDIAKASTFSRVTIYAYFKNRDDIIFAVFTKGGKKRIAMLEKNDKKFKTGIEKIYSVADTYYRFYKKYPVYLKLRKYCDNYEYDKKNINQDVLKEFNDYVKSSSVVIDAIKIAVEDGTIRKDTNIPNTFYYLTGALIPILSDAILSHQYDLNRSINGKKYFYDFLDLFIRGLKTQY